MFIQVIRGRATDRDGIKAMLDRWVVDLAPRAGGWLGTTAGMTAEGTFLAVVRFASTDAARRNSERPEQHQWWMETSKLFAGEVTFADAEECDLFLDGGSDAAGFVQVMHGTVTDREAMRRLDRAVADQLRTFRPDVIGGTVAHHADGTATQTVYFTSEAEARDGERTEPPEEVRQAMEESASLFRDVTYDDISEPWLYSPR